MSISNHLTASKIKIASDKQGREAFYIYNSPEPQSVNTSKGSLASSEQKEQQIQDYELDLQASFSEYYEQHKHEIDAQALQSKIKAQLK